MKVVTIYTEGNPKAKAFALKLIKHKERKMEELRLEGLAFLKKHGGVFPQK